MAAWRPLSIMLAVHVPQLVVDDDSLDGYFDEQTLWRGMEYAEEGRLLHMHWNPGEAILYGQVRGTGLAVYSTAVRFVANALVLEIEDCVCTCPVSDACKHAAALVMSACTPTSIADDPEDVTLVRRSRSAWETELEGLLPAPDQSDRLSLGIQLAVQFPAVSYLPKATRLLPTATLRPVTEGATGWVAGKLTWENLTYDSRFDPEQAAIMQEINAMHGRDYRYYRGGDAKTLSLATFHSPRLWPLLEAARAAGIVLVEGKKTIDTSTMFFTGRYCVDADASSRGAITVTPRLRVEGYAAPITPIVFIGRQGHGMVFSDPTATGQRGVPRMRLARLEPAVPPKAQEALRAQIEVKVPAAERERFLDSYVPRLRDATQLSVQGGHVDVPTLGPFLVFSVVFHPQQRVGVGWTLGYEVDGQLRQHQLPGPGIADYAGRYRDLGAEQKLLQELDIPFGPSGLARLDPSLLGRSPAVLAGLEALRLATELLRVLEEHPSVRVVTEGQAPDYRGVDDSVVVEMVPAQSTWETDWFDLGVQVSAEGREVPFSDVFAALCGNETHMILPDGAFFSLDKPQLRVLRQLIEEARELYDAPPGALRLSRFQAGLWQELVELGVVGRETAEWQRKLVELAQLRTIETAECPANVQADLRGYQSAGFAWLSFLWRHELGGILADDMGLGKTLQVLALICHAQQEGSNRPWLIVAPASVVSNWTAEAARFAPQLRTLAVTDTLGRSGRHIDDLTAETDVVITSYTVLRLDVDAYKMAAWEGLVLDEAQFVKNHQAKGHQCVRLVPARFKLAVTGTPMENNLMELWALLSITAPGLFPHPTKFRDYYAQPIEKEHDSERLAQLQRRIKPLMLRRTKEQVAADLPAKQEQVLSVTLAPAHRKLYDTRLQRERQKVLGLVDDMNHNRFTILRSLTVLRQLSLHAGLVDPELDHVASAKIDVLMEHLADVIAGGHRALVFSQFTEFLARVRTRLDGEDIEYCYLDGKTRRRGEVIQRFRDGAVPVFLISLKAGGFGVNLTEADYCFLMDPWWNPATEAQAVDRTHRIGQTRQVMVYRLIAADTIEQKVMDLKTRKSALVSGVLDDEGEGFSGALSPADVRELFQ